MSDKPLPTTLISMRIENELLFRLDKMARKCGLSRGAMISRILGIKLYGFEFSLDEIVAQLQVFMESRGEFALVEKLGKLHPLKKKNKVIASP